MIEQQSPLFSKMGALVLWDRIANAVVSVCSIIPRLRNMDTKRCTKVRTTVGPTAGTPIERDVYTVQIYALGDGERASRSEKSLSKFVLALGHQVTTLIVEISGPHRRHYV